MILSTFLKKENQSTKWGRFSINYDLLERILNAKEYLAEEPTKKSNLKVRTVIAY